MTLLPRSRAAEPDDDRAMTQSTHTFAHYPLNPDFIEQYSQKNCMGMYVDPRGSANRT